MRRSRFLTFQLLDSRLVFDGETTRPFDASDVNNDLNLTAHDALLVINHIARNRNLGSQNIGTNPTPTSRMCGRCDANNDARVTPLDALQVINALRRSPQRAQMRLVRDTAPDAALNDDGITSNLTIEGRLGRELVSSIKDGVHFFLGLPDSYANSGSTDYSIELTPYVNANYFRVPESEVKKIFPFIGNGIDGTIKLTLFSKTNVGEVTTAKSHGEIVVRWDARAPIIKVANQVVGPDQRFSILVSDHSELVESKSTDLFFGSLDQSPLDYTLKNASRETRIDVALTDNLVWTNDQLEVTANGILQDIAGNIASLPADFTLTRIVSPSLQIPRNQFPGLTAFDADAYVAVAGKSIRLPSSVNGQAQSLRFPIIVPPVDSSAPVQTSLIVRPWRQGIGEAFYEVPLNAVSGVVTDEFGDTVAKIVSLPGTSSVSIDDGRWSVASPFTSTFYYRIVADGDRLDVASPEQVAAWNRVEPGELVPDLKFGLIQLATVDGFTTPQYFVGKIGFANATAVVADESPSNISGLWVANGDQLVRIDGKSGGIIESVDFSTVDFSPGVPVLSVVVISALQNLPKNVLLPRTELIVDATSIQSDSLLVVSLSAGGYVAVDPLTAQVVGRVPSVEPENFDYFFQPAIYHPLRQSWISFSQDLSIYRERDVASGTLVAEKRVVGSNIILVQGVGGISPGLVWDSLHSRLVSRSYIQPINGIISSRTPSVEFDPVTGRLTSAAEKDWEFNGISFFAGEPGLLFTIDAQGRMIQVRGSGLIQRFDLQKNRTLLLTRIESKSILGVAANPLAPSANPGQWIELIGENLEDLLGSSIRFAYDNGSGDLTGAFINKDELVYDYNGNGTRVWVRVPDDARTGSLKLIGTEQSLALQIVPGVTDLSTRSQTPTPSLALTFIDNEDTQTLVLQSQATRIDDYRFRIDGIDVVDSKSVINLPPGYVNLHDLPLPRDRVEVISVGGSTTLPAPAISLASDPFVASSYSILERAFGASVQYEVGGLPIPASEVVTAGSTLAIEIVPRSTALVAVTYPKAIQFDFITLADGGGFRYKTVSGVQIDQGHSYRVELPFEFTGGKVAIRGARRDDGALPIRVAPTIFAATGDTSTSGASVLLSGINLSKAIYSIGGMPVVATDLSHLTSFDIDLVRVVVPNGMSASKDLVIVSGDVTANIGSVVPFWSDFAMPVANNGTPTYVDLPSLNPGQSLFVQGNGVSASTKFEGFGGRGYRLSTYSLFRSNDGS